MNLNSISGTFYLVKTETMLCVSALWEIDLICVWEPKKWKQNPEVTHGNCGKQDSFWSEGTGCSGFRT